MKEIIIYLTICAYSISSFAQNNDFSLIDSYSFTSKSLLTDSILKICTIKELDIIRNEIFARHGYIFKSEPYISHFSKIDWYKPVSTMVSLDSLESYNVNKILDHQAKRKPKLSIKSHIIKTGWSADMELPLRLWILDLTDKQITSIQQVLKLLTNEEIEMIGDLKLADNQIRDLKGIDKFINIESVNLERNYISKIEYLEHLKNLKFINLSDNYISKIENLPKKLDCLFLSNNKITIIENLPIVKLTFSIDNNPLKN